jgi:amino acid adenylation domain-containing protein/non-ribosomal peptide synthase protein (TIGR01720 family)
VNEIENEIFFNIEYCTALFKEATIQRMAVHFLNVIRQMISEPGIKIGDIDILTPGEKQQLLIDFNETAADYPGERTIHQLFEEQVRRRADNIAIVGPLQMEYRTYMTYITYRELNRKSNQLAHLLRERGVKPGTITGLMMERSVGMIVGILGVLKAGGAYLPLDSQYPAARKIYMLKDSAVKWLLTNVSKEGELAPVSKEMEVIDLRDKHSYTGDSSNPQHTNKASDLVYLIYTSGSTGKPKGVMLEHRNLVNLLVWMFRFTNIDPGCILQFATISFDASFHEIFSAFLCGGRLVLTDRERRTDIPNLFLHIEKNQVKTVFLPMSMLRVIFNMKDYIDAFPGCVKHIQTAGEQVVVSDMFRNYLQKNHIYLHNHYGPSETHVVTALTLDPAEEIPELPSIGKPVSNTVIYILDKYGCLQPVGVPGELYIGGDQVGRGYLNNPELTAEKFCLRRPGGTLFVKTAPPGPPRKNFLLKETGNHASMQSCNHPITPIPHSPIYRTGDLARWMAEGNIEFLGRIDYQVKIRGFRIEPGEIETQILNHRDVKEAVVVSREDAKRDKYLCAYIVPTSPGVFEQTPGITELKRYLLKKLPDYLVPSYFIQLEKIPLTGSGKVDRKALPEPVVKTGNNYAAPRNAVEEKLVKLWSEILDVGPLGIGIHDNFFELGGHSLKATILAAKIHQTFNIKISLAKIFKTPTIESLARYVKGAEKSIYDSIQPVEEKEYYALSSSQQRFYVIHRLAPDNLGYNLPQVVSLDKSVDKDKLEQTFKQLIHRHESLRTSFENLDGQPVQRVHAAVEFEIEYYDMEEVEAAHHPQLATSLIRNFFRPFDLSRAPLLRVGLMELPHTPAALRAHPRRGTYKSQEGREHNHLLVIDMNHIISDGTSQAILTRDFVSIYEGKKFPLLRLQYKDFSQWQNHLVRSEHMKTHEGYWLDRLKGPLPTLNLPTDFPRPQSRSVNGAHYNVTLGEALTRKVNGFIRDTGTTLYMLLLAAFIIILSRYSGQQDIIVGSPIAGRYHADLEDIIGLVIGSVMMRNFPYPQETFNDFLEEVKTNTLEAYEHQVYPFEELLKKVNWQEEPGRDPISDVALIVQNMTDPSAPVTLPEGFRIYDPQTHGSNLYSYFQTTSKLDITLYAIESQRDISLIFEYCTALFKPQTIERMAGHLETLLEQVINNAGIPLWEIDIISPGEKRAVIGVDARLYPLTHAQKRVYYTEKMYPHTGCNSLAFTVRYGEILDRNRMEAAIHNVILKNDALRLRIVEFDLLPEPYQYVAPYRRQPLDYLDFRGRKRKGEINLQKLIDKKTREPFFFINGPLFYFALVRFNDNESGYYMKLHHIVSDGWTIFLLSEQIDRLYQELIGGKGAGEDLYPSYLDYIREENRYLRSPETEKDREFWHKTLLPLPQEVNLSSSAKGNTVNASAQAEKLPVPNDLRTRMHDYCQHNKTSIYKLIFSALSIYISRAANCDDIVIGGAGSNRSTDHQKRAAGMFVSTIPFRVKLDEVTDFNCFVEKLGQDINFIIKNHQKYPYDLLLSEIREKSGADPGYLLNVNLIGHGDLKESRFKFNHHFPGYEPTPLCIHINADNKDINGILELEWDFQEERFSAVDIRQMHRTLINILTDVLDNPQKKLPYIALLTREEREQILYDFNDTAAGYSEDKIICQLFEEQVEKIPDKTALVGTKLQNTNYKQRGMHLTYNELNKKCDGLAHLLREKRVGPDTVVGLMVEPSPEMIVGILAILKSGSAYLPIDPEYPQERIDYMLSDSAVKLLLTTWDYSDEIKFEREMINISDAINRVPTPHLTPHHSSFIIHHSENLVYIIYTSGSTGRPKGVAVEHRNLMAYIHAFSKEFSLRAEDVVIQQASYCFDAFVEEMYPILLKRGKLAIPPKETIKDINLLAGFIFKHRVTLITCSPLLLNELNKLDPIGPISSIHTFISGGDILKGEYIDNLLKIGEVYNTYGPTEATVCATYYRCPGDCTSHVPIGKPIVNYNVYVLDKHKQLLPVGIPGELCISGPGVTRGYLNKPELTSEKFVLAHSSWLIADRSAKQGDVPASGDFQESPMSYELPAMSYFYKTGDLARWQPDGNIKFLGRMDDQVNIRGYRIEPGEIQQLLLKHENIKEAVVMGRKDKEGDEYLCAYIIPLEEMKMSELKEYLSNQLPAYMIPSFFVSIEKIPLTANGKIDWNTLPGPGLISGETYAAPRSDVERKLVEVWSRILGSDTVHASPGKSPSPIGIDANFFDIGGHSLKATQLVSQLQEEFQVNVPLAEIFKRPTVKGLSEYIKEATKETNAVIETAEEREYYALSSAQKRLYILHQMERTSTVYNMSTVVTLEGNLDREKLETTFHNLIARHESMRTSFAMVENEPVQKVDDKVDFAIEDYDLATEDTEGMASPTYYCNRNTHIMKEKSWNENKVSEWSSTENTAGMAALISSFIRPFDLSRAPLLRVGLMELPHTPAALRAHPRRGTYKSQEGREHNYLLVVDMHHIISDGISMGIIVKDLMALYGDRELPPLRARYKDYSHWQNRVNLVEKEKKVLGQQETYWLEQFEGKIPVLDLPLDYIRPSLQGFEGRCLGFEIGREETKALKTLAKKEEATIYIVLTAIFNVFLSKLSGQEDIVIGVPTSGRKHTVLSQVIGMFVNTLALRNYPGGEKTFTGLLREVRDRTLAAFDNQDYQYDDLLEQLSAKGTITRDVNRNPLFDVMLALQNLEIPEIEIPGLKLTPGEYKRNTSRFNMTFQAVEQEGELDFIVEYRTKLFKRETIVRFTRYFKELVSTVLESPGRKILEIEIIPEEEKKRILYEFNDTKADYPADRTIHQLFEEQVEKNPDNVALHGCMAAWLHGGIHITYCELNERSNQLACLLKEKGIHPDSIVGIMIERSIEMVLGMLGILKAGSAYLPLDPEYPEERKQYMLKDSGAKILLTLPGLSEKYEKLLIVNCQLLMANEEPYRRRFNTPPKEANSINNYQLTINNLQLKRASLAYIIYTSGSTGKPKGVIVEHASLVNLCCWHNRYFGVMESDRASQYASIGFDAAVWEIFPYLVRGVPLHIISNQVKYDIKAVNAYFERHHITIAFLPTPVCEQFMEFENRSLRLLLTGGDKLRTLKKRNYDLYNNYGPTENTVVTTSCPVGHYRDNIPIGKPIHNIQVYVFNRNAVHLQPIGVPGELCIVGRSLARGYLNNPELTHEKFDHDLWDLQDYQDKKIKKSDPMQPCNHASMPSPHHPITPIPHSPIYRTGDLARWLPDGNIEFLGRMDSQVKIRGSRVELGEIESQLLTHDGVKEAVVITVIHDVTRAVTRRRTKTDTNETAQHIGPTGREETSEKYLCAYIVPSGLRLSIRELKEYLRGKLPTFMIPLYFVKLEKMPLTPGGKVDRNALPAPTSAAIRDEYDTPKTPTTIIEKRLAEAWQEVLGIESIRIDEDFFEIGGDSIKAIQVSARLLKYGLKMEISDLLANPTIKQLGQCIRRTDNHHVPEQGTVEGKVQLTPIQKWFFRNNFTHNHHFNQSVMIYREVGFDESLLKQLFAKIVTHHDALRMVYRQEENGIVQWNRGLEEPLFDLKVMNLKDSTDITAEIENAANKIQRAIDLETGPLVWLGLFKTLDGDHLLIVIHHLAVDGVSWRILLEDIAAGYSQLEKGQKIVLQEKTDSLRYWSQKLVEFSGSKTLLKELEYWLAVEKTGISHLPKDFEQTGEKEKNNFANSESVTMNLDEEDTGVLLKEVIQAYNTEINDILLTALGMAVKEWTGIEKVVINLEGHGRENIIAGVDVCRTIGWFTVQFPVVLDMSRWQDLSYSIKFVKETLRKIPNKGIGYGILKYLTTLGKKEGLTFRMEPEISFNYLGQFDRGNRDGIFKISAMKMGDTVSPQSERTHSLNISGIITEGKLTMIFNYNKYEYKRSTIEKLVNGFQLHLLKIIRHCAQKDDMELSPVDMKYSKLTIEKLEELEDRVSGID